MARSLVVTVITIVRTGLGIGVPCGYRTESMYLVAGIGLMGVPGQYPVNVWVVFIYWMFKGEDMNVNLCKKFRDWHYDNGYRYLVSYSGRGTGKSYTVATLLLLDALMRPLRILCAREIQLSLSDSVHKLLCDRIGQLGLDNEFHITRTSITSSNGSEFIFKGLRSDPAEIKSMEGIQVCWVEEASNVSKASWDLLVPTIRKPGSQIWCTFNPARKEDWVYQMFVANTPPKNAMVVPLTIEDNPEFPDVLREEMEECMARDYDAYRHIWLGECVTHSNACVFKGHFVVRECPEFTTEHPYYGTDFGFSCLDEDTLVTTDKGDVKIKDIQVGDNVLTRTGYSRVTGTKKVGLRDVYALDFGYGLRIIATEDHRILTNRGWVQVKDLQEEETICVMKSSLMAKCTATIRKVSTQIISIIGSTIKTPMETNTGVKTSFIETSGRKSMVQFLKDTVSTIKTVIPSTILLRILCWLPHHSTPRYTSQTNLDAYPEAQTQDTPKRTGKNFVRSLWKQLKHRIEHVGTVVSHLPLLMSIKDSVVATAPITTITNTLHNVNMCVRTAVRPLWLALTTPATPVLLNVHINSQSVNGQKLVYDVSTENHEFLANGIIVHNCDANTCVECYVKDNTLFITKENYGVGVDIDKLPAFYDKVMKNRRFTMYGDCARPETISYLQKQGFNIKPCKKWKGCIEDRVEFIKHFKEVVIDPKCMHAIEEFNKYSYKTDRTSGDILPEIEDANNHIIDGLSYAIQDLIMQKRYVKVPRC